MRKPTQESYRQDRSLSVFARAVYAMVAQIPKGQVLTYMAVARRAGFPGASRAVGTALRKNRFRDVPCHRVIRADGMIGQYAFGGQRAKALRLRREGVRLSGFRIMFS